VSECEAGHCCGDGDDAGRETGELAADPVDADEPQHERPSAGRDEIGDRKHDRSRRDRERRRAVEHGREHDELHGRDPRGVRRH
jgi:hypothetical protein